MSVRDVLSHVDLSVYPQVALVLFLAVFAAIVVRVFRRRHHHEFWAHASSLPLNDGPRPAPAAQEVSDEQ